jgi:solute carrier family 13 (sodium-dependent dicarboxylate transporter), member 2/3/5
MSGIAAQDTTATLSLDNVRRSVGIPLALLVGLTIWAAGAPLGLSGEGHRTLVLFAAIFVLYLTEAIPLAVTSLLVAPAAVLLGIATPTSSLSGFASPSVYLILGAFILAAAMVKMRLAERITYRILLIVGCTTSRITLGVTLANSCWPFSFPRRRRERRCCCRFASELPLLSAGRSARISAPTSC